MKINLTTKPADIIETMREELPSERYQFRKANGGNLKYAKLEDHLLDKALEDEESQFTDINEHISRYGNRWITYTHVEYYPKAKHAQAYHMSFVYYETYASCGAFLPMYSPAKSSKKIKVDGVLIFTDHFFLRMAERTGKKYRSKELIREFITTKSTNASQTDDEGEVIIRFKGGYGFGIEKSKRPHLIEIRTYLTDNQLSPKQKKKCEKVDAYSEIVADGMSNEDIAILTAYNSTSEEWLERAIKTFNAAQKIGIHRRMVVAASANAMFIRLMCDIIHMDEKKLTQASVMVIFSRIKFYVDQFARKYEKFDEETATPEEIQQFNADLIDMCTKCAKRLSISTMTREAITKRYTELCEESKN